jgi:hypothetical protein
MSDSLLKSIGEKLIDLVLNLASDEIKDKLKDPTSQDLLLRLNKLFFQLSAESNVFVTRLDQLIDYAKSLNITDNGNVSDEKTSRLLRREERRDEIAYYDDEEVQQVNSSIIDIRRTLKKIVVTTKSFAPTLAVYNIQLVKDVEFAYTARDSLMDEADIMLKELFNMNWALDEFERQSIPGHVLGELQTIYNSSTDALKLIHQAQSGLQDLVRETYPTIKDLPS